MYKLVNISKSFGNKNNLINVIRNVNLTLPSKGFVSVLGKSGSGKSTLLNLLIGIDKPNHGEIYYLGQNINKLKGKKKKYYQNSEIGVLFQHFNLFEELSSIDNVILPAMISGINERKARDKAKEYFDRYKINNLITQKYKTLSGGEKQRVALIRALINDPKVIIADEPTGALDSKNGNLIINDLKELSKDHLVIVVTHNEELIRLYEDYRIVISNGEIKFNKSFKVEQKELDNKKKCNNKILSIFTRLHIKEHKVRNILVSASIIFSSLCFLSAYGYVIGSKESINNYKRESLLYQKANISKKTLIEIPDSPIVISKLSRPKLEEIDFMFDEISSLKIENSYQIVVPSFPKMYFDNKALEDVDFSCVYNFESYKNILIEGKTPLNDFDSVVVNEEFIDKLGFKKEEIIDRKIKLSILSDIVTKDKLGKSIKDEVELNNELKISGVVKEFAFLNSPRIYYSYIGLKNLLKIYELKNISQSFGRSVFVNEIISNCDGSDPNSGYSYNLFIGDIEEVPKLFEIKKRLESLNEFEIDSISFDISNSYSSLVDVISSSLIVFIILIFLGSFFIVSITSYASFIQNKKESAILSILGLNKSNLFSIYNRENLFITIISLFISFCLIFPVQKLVNLIISNFFRLNNIIQINLISLPNIIYIILIILVSIFSSLIPFLTYENGHILNEIKDE